MNLLTPLLLLLLLPSHNALLSPLVTQTQSNVLAQSNVLWFKTTSVMDDLLTSVLKPALLPPQTYDDDSPQTLDNMKPWDNLPPPKPPQNNNQYTPVLGSDVTAALNQLDLELSSYLPEPAVVLVFTAIQKATNYLSKKPPPTQTIMSVISLLSILATSKMPTPGLIGAAFHHANATDIPVAYFPAQSRKILSKLAVLADIEKTKDELLEPRSTNYEYLRNLLLTQTCVDSLMLCSASHPALTITCATLLLKLRTAPSPALAHLALHLFSPLASRLALGLMKDDLLEAAFQVLYPRQYEKCQKILSAAERPQGLAAVLDSATVEIKRKLFEDDAFMANIATLSVTARRKSNFSLWKKVVKGGREGFDDVPDALGLRVVLEAKKLSPDETETETRYREAALCYYVQASAMSVFQEQGKRFVKDYIDKPKVNGYKSLHVGLGVLWHGRMWPVELQIRSAEMHRVAEFGIAAHWQYKTRETKTKALAKSDSTIDASLVSYLQGLRDHDAATTDVPPPPSPPTSFTRDAELLRQLNEQEELRRSYLTAFNLDRIALVRENLYCFVQDRNGSGSLVRLNPGSTVADAVKSVLGPSDTASYTASVNGDEVDERARLHNGDVVKVGASGNARLHILKRGKRFESQLSRGWLMLSRSRF